MANDAQKAKWKQRLAVLEAKRKEYADKLLRIESEIKEATALVNGPDNTLLPEPPHQAP